ncbi:MAG: hypothetical protein HC912_04445 [Saprospiraceae bacterium]|nr:hypothetical protein [Saprospiraceae bacterium]
MLMYCFLRCRVLLLLVGVSACQPKLQSRFCTFTDVVPVSLETPSSSFLKIANLCRSPLAYAPDTAHLAHFSMRYVRLNIHFVNSSDSTKNYVGEEALAFAHNLVHNANTDLQQNAKMHLPIDNQTSVLPINIQYVITPKADDPTDKGIYFHFDDELCYYVHKGKNRNNYNRDVIDKYGVQVGNVINVFIMPHHPDSVASPTYVSSGVGVALGTNIKMAGMYEDGGPFWRYRQILNHEVGHVFGLYHAWAGNDGCEDTPHHPNCWNYTEEGPCHTLVSNNVMDYNAWQLAWTPCQIGRVHELMSQTHARQRQLLVPTWCQLDESKTLFIQDTIHWQGAKDVEGNIIIAAGAVLQLSCRLALPKGATITVEPGGKLILNEAHLHNDCNEMWQGIVLQTKGKAKGEVQWIGNVKVENAIYAMEDIKN